MSEKDKGKAAAPQKRVTIYDVAKEAKVAPSTVSRAFSRPGRVNAETGARIRQAAAKLGYRTRPIAHPQSTQSHKVLAFVVADVSNPVYADLMRGFQKEATANGYTVMLIDSQEDDLKERKAIEQVLDMVDGVSLASSRMSDSSVSQIAKVKPVVVLNRVIMGIPSIIPDFARGLRHAVEHLASLGHRKITYLCGPAASWADGARWRAISEACFELNVNVRRIGPNPPTLQGGVEAAKQWLRNRTSAVIAYNDVMGIGFMKAIQKAALRVPQDVSVVGVDNSISGLITNPAMTTVGPPSNTLGVVAARSLISQLRHKSEPQAGMMTVPMKLFARESTRKLN